MNAGYGVGILDLGEPGMRDMEFGVAFYFGNPLTEISNLARSDP